MTLNVIYCRLKIYDWENRHCETLIVPEGVIMSQNINAGKEERTVDLRRVFSVILKRAWIIVTVAVISGLAAFFYTSWFVTPTYRASFSAYVNNRMVSEGEIKTSSSDMSASMDLMYVYQDIITSRSVLMEAVRRCDSTEFGDVERLVQCSVSSNAPILRVYVQSEDPKLAYQLACAIEDVAPDYVKAIVEGSSMRTIDSPRVSSKPYSPDVSETTTFSVLLGLLVTILAVVVLDLVHDKVRGSEELEARYDLPVIGRIPDMHQLEKSGERYGQTRKEEA